MANVPQLVLYQPRSLTIGILCISLILANIAMQYNANNNRFIGCFPRTR